jgi:hypothetical protein
MSKNLPTSAPASTLSSSAHSSSACRLQQRAGLKGYFANSEPYLAIRRPPVNLLDPFLFQ